MFDTKKQMLFQNFRDMTFDLLNRSILSKEDWDLTLNQVVEKIENKEKEIIQKISNKNIFIMHIIEDKLYQNLKSTINKIFSKELGFNVFYLDDLRLINLKYFDHNRGSKIFLRNLEMDKENYYTNALKQISPESILFLFFKNSYFFN